MIPSTVTPGYSFVMHVIAWLTSPVGDSWAKRHGKTLADWIERSVFNPKPAETARLAHLLECNVDEARGELVHFLWRCEHAQAFGSPPWTRSFSGVVGFMLWRNTWGLGATVTVDARPFAERDDYEDAQRRYAAQRLVAVHLRGWPDTPETHAGRQISNVHHEDNCSALAPTIPPGTCDCAVSQTSRPAVVEAPEATD